MLSLDLFPFILYALTKGGLICVSEKPFQKCLRQSLKNDLVELIFHAYIYKSSCINIVTHVLYLCI